MIRVGIRRSRRLALTALVIVVGTGASTALWLRFAPLPDSVLQPSSHVSTRVVDRNGEPLYERLSRRETRTLRITTGDVPLRVEQATIAAEDRRFHQHWGVDPIAIARAMVHNARHLGIVEGGSTLTQQVAKQLLSQGPQKRTLRAKVDESILAMRLEARLSKREILALYLNLAPYGNQFVGVGAASRGYFGVAPSELTTAQAAFLAALPQRPSAMNGDARGAGRAVRRQQAILARMEREGMISPEESRISSKERLQFQSRNDSFPSAPHFVLRLLASLDEKPALIETTLDAQLQSDVRSILASHRQRLGEHGASNVAVVVLDNARGEWLAWEGSGNFFGDAGGMIDGVTSPRQPGSALKPFTYALAFERSANPATVLPDIPSHFPTAEEGILYAPRNYDGRFRGPMRARAALAGSENVPAVALLSQHGVGPLLGLFRRLGFTTFSRTADHYGLGLTLGDAEVRLDEIVRGYAVFARGGIDRVPTGIRRTIAASGTVSVAEPSKLTRLFSTQTAFWIAAILSDSAAREYAFGDGNDLDFPFPVAVKTGTSQAYHDNWTIGFSRDVTVGVWVGNFDRTPLRNSSGVTGAAPIFHAVMLAAHERVSGRRAGADTRPLAERPPGLHEIELCALSGEAAGTFCEPVIREWLPLDRPIPICRWHRGASPDVVVWPREYQEWARGHGMLAGASTERNGSAQRRQNPLTIVSPPPGAIYLIDPTLRKDYQKLTLRASVSGGRRPIEWSIDGRHFARVQSDRRAGWPLSPGEHRVVATDGIASAEVRILVK